MIVIDYEMVEQLQPPYRINVRGVISNIGTARPTTSGRLMRTIELVDGKGKTLSIQQLGEDNDDRLQKGIRVGAYYLSAKKAFGSQTAGSLWAYGNSIFVVESTNVSIPKANQEVTIAP